LFGRLGAKLQFNVLNSPAAELAGNGKSPLTACALLLEEVVTGSVSMQNFAILGDTHAIFGAAMSL
jgi:hypothetical protein